MGFQQLEVKCEILVKHNFQVSRMQIRDAPLFGVEMPTQPLDPRRVTVTFVVQSSTTQLVSTIKY